MPTPISIFNRKVFANGGNIEYTTEPIYMQGYRKAVLGFTVHGLGVEPVSTVGLTFEHSAAPETNVDASWTTLTATSGSFISTTGVQRYILEEFLPYVRVKLQCNSGGGSGNLRICEVSLAGHAFEVN